MKFLLWILHFTFGLCSVAQAVTGEVRQLNFRRDFTEPKTLAGARVEAYRAELERARQHSAMLQARVNGERTDRVSVERQLQVTARSIDNLPARINNLKQEISRLEREERDRKKGFLAFVRNIFKGSHPSAELAKAREELADAEKTLSQARRSHPVLLEREREFRASADRAREAQGQLALVEDTFAELDRRAEIADIRYERRRSVMDAHLLDIFPSGPARLSWRRAIQRFQADVFNVPSDGYPSSRDAYAFGLEKNLLAVADGISLSEFSGEWARVLAAMWTSHPPEGFTFQEFARWIELCQERFFRENQHALDAQAALPHYRNHTFVSESTFLGIKLVKLDADEWAVPLVAVGDTVALLVRGDNLIDSFPLKGSSAAQRGRTASVSTRQGPHEVDYVTDLWIAKRGDEIFTLTDAVANWAFETLAAGGNPFPILRNIRTTSQMESFIRSAERKEYPGNTKLKRDDRTRGRIVLY